MRTILGLALVMLFSAPAAARDEAFLRALDRGEIAVYTREVKDCDHPELVLKAVINAPPQRVWRIVRDCGNYQRTIPRVKASELISRKGTKVACRVTVDVPFPYSDKTSITDAVHTTGPPLWSRVWKLRSGDYRRNEGAWLLRYFRGDRNRTYVVYRVLAVTKAWVPGWIKNMAQKRSLPKMIKRIRRLVGHKP